jgi:hypothetical protein
MSGINDIRLTSNLIEAASHEFDETEITIPPINVVQKRFSVGLLGIGENIKSSPILSFNVSFSHCLSN